MTTIKDILKFKDGRTVDVQFPIALKDSNGLETYLESANGFRRRREYDANGNVTYYENSDGFWYKKDVDANGNETYYEASNGFRYRREYDADGNETYYENSEGYKRGTPKTTKVKITVEGKTIEISRESAKALGLIK